MDDLSSQPLLATEFDEEGAAISPDGRWIAHISNETGIRETYVRPFPNFDYGKWQISAGGGIDIAWGPDGSELFYLVDNDAVTTIMVVEVDTAPVFSAGSSRVLLEGDYVYLGGSHPSYAVSPDGEHFLILKAGDLSGQAQEPPKFIIVQNWLEELNELAPPAE